MPPSDPADTRDLPDSSISRKKMRKSNNDSDSKKREYGDDMRLADGSGSRALRRSSISKPGRDRRDEPTFKRQKRQKPHQMIDEDEEGDVANAGDDSKAAAEATVSFKRSDSPIIDFDGLSRPSVGTRQRLEQSAEEAVARRERIKGAVRTILECIGENPDREGLLATPDRYANAMMTLTEGYERNVFDIVNGAIFQENHSEMVIVKDVDIYSVCEHHLLPFIGKIHIGYIPNNAVIGISKLPRIAEMFARRLQIQERLTKDVANAIFNVLRPQGVAVVMESSHLCSVMRGVQKANSTTITSCMLGCFERRSKTRNEFLSLIGVNRR